MVSDLEEDKAIRRRNDREHIVTCGASVLPVCVSMCLCSELAQGKTRGQKGQVIFWTELEYAFFFPLG